MQDGEQRSENYGSTFHPLSLGTPATAFFPSGPRALAAISGGVLVSDDGGASWRTAQELSGGAFLEVDYFGDAELDDEVRLERVRLVRSSLRFLTLADATEAELDEADPLLRALVR